MVLADYMDVLFLDAPYTGKVELCQETLRYLQKKKFKKIALYASVQFCHQLSTVRKQLEQAKISVITTKTDRAHMPGQLLGCDSYHQSLHLDQNIDCFLYVGDGKFHPLALVYAQKDVPVFKEVVCDDPLRHDLQVLGLDEIQAILLKYKAALMRFLSSKNIGIIITIKPGQEQLKPSFAVEQKYADKKFYYFIDNTISFDQLENFNFIDVWINTACPRIGFDDQEKFRRGVINLTDALQAEKILGQLPAFTIKHNPPGNNRRKKGNI